MKNEQETFAVPSRLEDLQLPPKEILLSTTNLKEHKKGMLIAFSYVGMRPARRHGLHSFHTAHKQTYKQWGFVGEVGFVFENRGERINRRLHVNGNLCLCALVLVSQIISECSQLYTYTYVPARNIHPCMHEQHTKGFILFVKLRYGCK